MDFTKLGNTCVIGLQWGDEGKGKIVDLLMGHFDVSVRYSGGANAGHTVIVGSETFALHQLPSGCLRPTVRCVITGGTVIDPAVLLGEMAALEQRGIDLSPERFKLSDRAHLVFPWHRKEDVLAEKTAHAGSKLGTTARGIGPCYSDKVSRHWGVRICEMQHPDRFRERLARIAAQKNAYFAAVYSDPETLDGKAIANEYLEFAAQLAPHVCDTTQLLRESLDEGRRLLFEGAQGAMLDVDHGTYPYVTSSSATGGGVATGAGVPLSAIQGRVGVIKAYSTRVGAGPMPTELADRTGEWIRERGGEYGTTTGRARRCGWFDAVAASYAANLVDPTHLAIMHLDTLAGMDELKVCVGYRCDGKIVNRFPADTYALEQAEPVYETLPGWDEDLGACRDYDALPKAARGYVEWISERLRTPIGMIGVGPARDQVIMVGS